MDRVAAQALVAGVVLFASPALATADRQASETLDTHEVSFSSHGVGLRGTVVIPKRLPVVAAAVFVQGAGPDRRATFLAEALARLGSAHSARRLAGLDRVVSCPNGICAVGQTEASAIRKGPTLL